jgi:hypothetical protein
MMDAKLYQLMERARQQGEEFQTLSFKQQSLAAVMLKTVNEIVEHTNQSKDRQP